MKNALARKPAPTTSNPRATAPAGAAAKGAKEDLRKAAGAVGFAEGSRMLAPPAAAVAGKAPAPAAPPKATQVSQHISDAPYGWTSKFDVSFTEKECLIALRVKLEAQDGVSAEDVARVAAQSKTAFTRFFDNRFKLTDGKTGKVFPIRTTVDFVDADPHLVVKLRKGQGRDNLSNWFVQSEAIVRAHELGHQLGLKDEYIDPGAESRKDASAPGVRTDNSLMGNFWAEGVDTAAVKTRHAQDIANLVGGAKGNTYSAAAMEP